MYSGLHRMKRCRSGRNDHSPDGLESNRTEQYLDNISVAYRNKELIWDQVFPLVPVEKKSDFYFIFARGDWLRDEVEVRAPGARARRVDYALSSASYNCLTYGAAHGIPDEVRQNADRPLRPDRDATEFITDKLQLAVERRVASIVTTCGNWASASNPATQWSNDASEPLDDIETAKDAVISKTGVVPNVCVIAQTTWRVLRNHPDIIARVQYGGFRQITPQLLADIIDVPKVLIGRSIYNTALEGATDSISYVWGDMLWVGYVPGAPALMTPAAGYTLQWGGNEVSRFREDQEHQDVIEVSWATDEVICASDSGAIMSDCVA